MKNKRTITDKTKYNQDKYHIYNKVLQTSHETPNLVRMFGSAKIISIESAIKTNGFWEDDMYHVTEI